MTTVSEFVIGRIREWGVRRVFGFPGDGIGEFDGALGKAEREGDGLEYIRPTHEEIAALMATAHAKFTGEVGVCIATSSPGGFHLLNGLYDAKMDNQPVVAIVGQQGLDAFGTSNQQESHLERTFSDVAAYVQTIVSPAQAQAVVDAAFRIAITRLQPCVIIFPHDIQGEEMVEPGKKMWVSRSSAVAPSTALAAPPDQCRPPRTSSTPASASRSWSATGRTVRPRKCWRRPGSRAPASSRRCAGSRWCPPTCRSTPSSWGCSARARATSR